jgi:HEAT repeat protein
VTALRGALFDSYPLVRVRAAESLKTLGDKEAVPDLVRRVADDLWMAPQRIALTGNAYAGEFSDPEWGGKTAALNALRELAPQRVEEALTQALRSTTPAVRFWAAERLKPGKPD